MSNFLGDLDSGRTSMILSHGILELREGQGIQKNMNFRDDGRPSVFLISDRGAEFTDEWHEDEQLYIVDGHDKSAAKARKRIVDQQLAHESGRLSDNGLFYREAKKYKDGARTDALQIQVYERLDAGVWYDKGLFNLIDAREKTVEGRKVYSFVLSPVDGRLRAQDGDPYRIERIIPARVKALVWAREGGRCAMCGADQNLFFTYMQNIRDGGRSDDENNLQLRCAAHAGGRTGLL